MEDPSSVVVRDRAVDGELVEFLAPGLIHALGNQLFAIQGSVHVLKDGPPGKRQRATILEAAGEAEKTVDVLRLLADSPVERTDQAGVLLTRIASLCRVPLRERGLRLDVGHTSARRPRMVDARAFARVVVDLTRRVSARLPTFLEGTLRIDLSDQTPRAVTVEVRIELEPTCLPFPMDLGGVAVAIARAHDASGITAEQRDGDVLCVHVPAVR